MFIRRSKFRNAKEQRRFIVLAFVAIAENLVTILSLGFYACDWRAQLLFSGYFDE